MDYNSYRRKSRKVKVGKIFVGGDAPIPVQSMTNVSSSDFDALYSPSNSQPHILRVHEKERMDKERRYAFICLNHHSMHGKKYAESDIGSAFFVTSKYRFSINQA